MSSGHVEVAADVRIRVTLVQIVFKTLFPDM